MRAFEMPPHARMSVAQQLLLRALVARFWDRRPTSALTRWGTELHDASCCRTSSGRTSRRARRSLRGGLPFDPTGSRRTSSSASRARRLRAARRRAELRHALEPWHVLGEEPGGGGTVRYVDSSVERLQVKAVGLNERATSSPATAGACRCAHRHGRRVRRGRALPRLAAAQSRCIRPSACTRRSPSTSTTPGAAGRSAAAVPRRPSRRPQLRPTFRSTPTRPRRAAARASSGHSPGDMPEPRPIDNPEHPLTLDLRRA
jgi:uncharacterized protein (DUF2126 family)